MWRCSVGAPSSTTEKEPLSPENRARSGSCPVSLIPAYGAIVS
jgi:hypothetical protein